MPGAWEVASQAKVLVGTLHTDVTTVAWALGLRNLIIPGGLPPLALAGMPYDHARNVLAMRSLELGCTHCFMLDSDVIPPHDAIPRLLSHNLPLVSGLYARRSPPHSLPVMMKNFAWVTDYRPGSLVEVDVVGAGCLLISCELLKQCPPQETGYHWFYWKVNLRGSPGEADQDCMSEDFTFLRHVKRVLGIKTFVDTSCVCRHVGAAEFTPGDVRPLDCVSVT